MKHEIECKDMTSLDPLVIDCTRIVMYLKIYIYSQLYGQVSFSPVPAFCRAGARVCYFFI